MGETMALSTTVTRPLMRRRWGRVAMAATVAAVTMTATAAGPAPSVVSAGSPGGDDGLVIVDAGDPSDRVSLLVPPAAGSIAEVTSIETFESAAVDSASGDEVGVFDASLTSQQTVVVSDVRPNGTFVTRSRIDDAETEGSDELILGLDFTELVGMSWESVVAPNGVLLDSELVDSGRLTETARSMTGGLPGGMLALLPGTPVGTGARWTIDFSDITGDYSYDVGLVEVSADRFLVEFDYRLDATSFDGDTTVDASTVGHGDFDGSLSERLDATTRLADTSTVVADGDDIIVVITYTMVSTSRPLAAG